MWIGVMSKTVPLPDEFRSGCFKKIPDKILLHKASENLDYKEICDFPKCFGFYGFSLCLALTEQGTSNCASNTSLITIAGLGVWFVIPERWVAQILWVVHGQKYETKAFRDLWLLKDLSTHSPPHSVPCCCGQCIWGRDAGVLSLTAQRDVFMASCAGFRWEEGSLPTAYFSVLWAPQFISREDEQSRIEAKRQKLDV